MCVSVCVCVFSPSEETKVVSVTYVEVHSGSVCGAARACDKRRLLESIDGEFYFTFGVCVDE